MVGDGLALLSGFPALSARAPAAAFVCQDTYAMKLLYCGWYLEIDVATRARLFVLLGSAWLILDVRRFDAVWFLARCAWPFCSVPENTILTGVRKARRLARCCCFGDGSWVCATADYWLQSSFHSCQSF